MNPTTLKNIFAANLYTMPASFKEPLSIERPTKTPVLFPAADDYEELLLQWSNDTFFGDDDESLAAVYAEEIAR